MVYVCESPWFTVVTPDGVTEPLDPEVAVMVKVTPAEAENVALILWLA